MGRDLSSVDKQGRNGESFESTVDKKVGIGERLEPCRHLVGNWGKDELADGKRRLTLSFNRLALSRYRKSLLPIRLIR